MRIESVSWKVLPIGSDVTGLRDEYPSLFVRQK